jgi:hypothetical protein
MNPVIISMLLCRDSAASAFLDPFAQLGTSDEMGAQFKMGEIGFSGGVLGGGMGGDEILLRTKFDLDAHEERYEYLSETVCDPVSAGETIDAVAEFVVPDCPGRYWGCFKVLRQNNPEFYCAFRYHPPLSTFHFLFPFLGI